MSHAPKIVSLTPTAILLFAGGISVAAPPDPTKQISPYQGQATPLVGAKLPDLVPWKEGGGIGVTSFYCYKEGETYLPTPALKILFGYKNIGIEKAGPFKVLVKVNGAVWNYPQNPSMGNPFTWPELPPNYSVDWQFDGSVPGPGMYTLWVKVDSEDAVAELNETNNVATATTFCGDPRARQRRVEPPKLYPKPKIGPPPVEQQVLPPSQSK